MRFWITKTSGLSIREQLTRQVLLGILSEELPPGQKLPSVRALARRHGIHPNTVSAAYHDLLEQGWLELRRGNGLFVRAIQSNESASSLDSLLTAFLKTARKQGFEPAAVLDRLQQFLRPRAYKRILIIEPDAALREILAAELGEVVDTEIRTAEAVNSSAATREEDTLVVALPTRARIARRQLPPGTLCLTLRLRSVGDSLVGRPQPTAETILYIASASSEIRAGTRALLIAIGRDPDSLCEIDTTNTDWQNRLIRNSLIIADLVAARDIPADFPVERIRLIADSTLSDLQQLWKG